MNKEQIEKFAEGINDTPYKNPLELMFSFSSGWVCIVRDANSLRDGFVKACVLMSKEGQNAIGQTWKVQR